jgi:dihydrofolate reductase
LRQGTGSGIIIFGSGTIVQQLTAEGLIDGYYFVVTPVILGAGKSLFARIGRRNLELIDARMFTSGNAVLHYRMQSGYLNK